MAMAHKDPQSRNETILQNILGELHEILPAQSRVEAILQAILYNTEYTEEAQSRIEALLLAIKNGGSFDDEARSRNEAILLAKLNGEEYTAEPQSRIEELLIEWLEAEPAWVLKTVSGSIISIDDAIAAPAEELTVNLPVTQEGSGDPSPDNIRDFIGFSGVTVTRSNGVDTEDTYSISFGQSIYSGVVDVKTGILSITHEIVDLGNLGYQYRDNYELFYTGVNTSVKLATTNCACSGYLFNPDAIDTSLANVSRKINDKEITTFSNENNQGRFVIKDTNYTDVASLKEAIAGIKLVYELATPVTIQLTPVQVQLLKDNNTLFADAGDLTLTYKAKA